MFSGIIDRVGTLRESRTVATGRTLTVDAPGYWADVDVGGSIAIDGVCLTLTQSDSQTARFDVIAETLRQSTLGDLRATDSVNLQKCLKVGDRVDGHFVQGHVDCIGEVSRVEQSETESIWWFLLPRECMVYITPKGSVAIDGISLTIAAVRDYMFSVALIPTTLDKTTLGRKRVGSRVNIETDILARTVVHYLASMTANESAKSGGLTLESLSRHGFA